MTFMTCPKCGTDIPIEADACPKCGSSLVELESDTDIETANKEEAAPPPAAAETPAPPTAPRKNKNILTTVIAIILIIAVVAAGGIFLITPYLLTDKDKTSIHNVSEQIDKIGEVTLNSAAFINEADAAFHSLTPKLQKHVENRDTLTRAKDAFSNLQIARVEEAVKTIGTVSLKSGESISSVRQLYNTLTPEQQQKVTNYQTLTDAEAQLSHLRIENAIKLNNAIGTVTLDSENAIKAAYEAYNILTQEEANAVTNAYVLYDAKVALDALKKAEADEFVELAPGETIKSTTWQLKYKSSTLTNAIYPDNTEDVYKIFTAPDKQLFIDTIFTVKNLSADPQLLNTIVSTYKATYSNVLYLKVVCYYSTEDTFSRVGTTETVDPKKSVTLHITTAIPIDAKKTDLPIKVELTVAGEKHVINVR